MDYAFHCYNSMAELGATQALRRLIGECEVPPVVVCIGGDLAIGDSLGPITGTLLKTKAERFTGYVYGTLKSPVTAKEVGYLGKFLRGTHPNAKIIAVDAAVGDESEIGLVKVTDGALKPGAGANKRLGKVGDVSLLGIVARKTAFSYSLLNLTRLNIVYRMAEILSEAIASLYESRIK